MPRYYFHVRDGHEMPDLEGTELPSDDAAWVQAVTASTEIIKELGLKFFEAQQWEMRVMEGSRHVFTLNFSGRITPVKKAE